MEEEKLISKEVGRKARWMIIIRIAVVTATLGSAGFIFTLSRPVEFSLLPIYAILLGTYVLSVLYWLGMKHSPDSAWPLYVQIAFDAFIVTVVVYYTGGTQSSFVPLYFLVILAASVFFKSLITVAFTALASAFYIVLAVLEYEEVVVTPIYAGLELHRYPGEIALNVFLYIFLFIMVAIIGGYATRSAKRSEAFLRDVFSLLKEARLDTNHILQNISSGLVTVDRGGRIIYFNRAAEQILDLKMEHVVGRIYDEVLLVVSPNMVDIIYRVLEGDVPSLRDEVVLEGVAGKTIGLTSSLITRSSGEKSGVITIFRDLTDIKKMEELVRRSDRMAAIGELAAGIAHEIRNPLASICGAVEMLRDEVGPHGEGVRLMELVERESGRLNRIVEEFLAFARIKPASPKDISIVHAIEDVKSLVKMDPRCGENIDIVVNTDGDLRVYFDDDHLTQVLFNLMINGVEAIDGDGTILIEAKSFEEPLKGGQKLVKVSVSDTGRGIRSEDMEKIFEPFFSTKKGGTGLGLSLIQRIVASNDGYIEAESSPGKGSTFTLYLQKGGQNESEENIGRR